VGCDCDRLMLMYVWFTVTIIGGKRVKGQKGEPGARNNDGIKSDTTTLKSKVEVDATMTTINRILKARG